MCIRDRLGITDENLKTWESVKTFGLIGENTKVHKGEALFPRLDIEKEVEELNELFSEKKDEPKEELIAVSYTHLDVYKRQYMEYVLTNYIYKYKQN